MSMEYVSIYLCLLQFLLLMSHTFQYMGFTFLVKFIPRYFIPFDAIINRTVFLISLSDSSLLVYRDTTDFLCTDFVSYSFTEFRDFPGGTVVKNPPADAVDRGSSPGSGRSHMPWSN